MAHFPQPHGRRAGFEALRKQQEAFLKSMMGGVPGWGGSRPGAGLRNPGEGRRLAEIKRQLAELQSKLEALIHGRNGRPRHALGIEVFLAAAEEGAISAAARRLGVSPSAVSQQLTGLESALGAPCSIAAPAPWRSPPPAPCSAATPRPLLNAAEEARAELALAELAGLTTLRLE